MAEVKYRSLDEFQSEYAIFMHIVRHLWELKGEAEMRHLADCAEVHFTTLYNWRSGVVSKPRIDTLVKVAHALGYELCWKRTKKRPKLHAV